MLQHLYITEINGAFLQPLQEYAPLSQTIGQIQLTPNYL